MDQGTAQILQTPSQSKSVTVNDPDTIQTADLFASIVDEIYSEERTFMRILTLAEVNGDDVLRKRATGAMACIGTITLALRCFRLPSELGKELLSIGYWDSERPLSYQDTHRYKTNPSEHGHVSISFHPSGTIGIYYMAPS